MKYPEQKKKFMLYIYRLAVDNKTGSLCFHAKKLNLTAFDKLNNYFFGRMSLDQLDTQNPRWVKNSYVTRFPLLYLKNILA